jgi:tetratricopeptide (TPR) repeat protein
MYPDRAVFGKIVDEEPDLSRAGRETLRALYDGPLKIRQILTLVNASGPAETKEATKERTISESALRKRLDVLIGRGIIARAGSERTNPYYFIRRSWLFNRYILIRCRENPSGGLLDLRILLGEISRETPGRKPDTVQPRVISAIGERTERSHEVAAAYRAFRERLGNPDAIGDYLESIYDAIFTGAVPASDIDGSLARDFLRFVATAPPEEHEVRFFFWYAQFFQTLDLYEASSGIFDLGVGLATERGLPLHAILGEARITRGSILLHLNNLAGAKDAFLADSQKSGAVPFVQAKNLFGAGETELICGDIAPALAPARFARASELAAKADPDHTNPDVDELKGDILRRTGTLHRINGQYDRARECYAAADAIYQNDMFRGRALLLPERAELERACAVAAADSAAADRYLKEAASLYEEAKTAAQRIRIISRFAYALIGECELARVASRKFNRPLPGDIAAKYANAFDISCQIGSKWGMVQCFLSEALLYHTMAEEFPDKYADTAGKLEQAEAYARELGLKNELAVIRRIKTHTSPACELNPLVFL